jgi:hypothetical protein
MASVTIRDETATGRAVDSWVLPELPPTVTARELVRCRVREEVARFNAARGEYFRGLVQPTGAEVTGSGFRLRHRRALDWQQQADAACQAFNRNGFVMFVGERQVEDLDEEVDLAGDPQVAFVRLVPLVGG